MAGAFFNIGLRDSSNEVGSSKWNIGDLTALSLAGALTDMGALTTAIENVTLGEVSNTSWGDSDARAYARPTDAQAQRGVKWTVSWQDTVTFGKGSNTIPTANLDLLPTVGGNRVEDLDLTTGAGAALKTAIEGLARSPAGNTITVLRVYYSD